MISREEAIEIAKKECARKNWLWEDPIYVRESREGCFGPSVWRITTNSRYKGGNVRITIRKKTGEIIKSAFVRK